MWWLTGPLCLFPISIIAVCHHGSGSVLETPKWQDCRRNPLYCEPETRGKFQVCVPSWTYFLYFLQWFFAMDGQILLTVCIVFIFTFVHMSSVTRMRSYTIDFGCERTKALFSKDEWEEMKELDDFQLPKLPELTERYLRDVRKAVVQGQHAASVPVPEEDRYSCELVLRSFLSWWVDCSDFLARGLMSNGWPL